MQTYIYNTLDDKFVSHVLADTPLDGSLSGDVVIERAIDLLCASRDFFGFLLGSIPRVHTMRIPILAITFDQAIGGYVLLYNKTNLHVLKDLLGVCAGLAHEAAHILHGHVRRDRALRESLNIAAGNPVFAQVSNIAMDYTVNGELRSSASPIVREGMTRLADVGVFPENSSLPEGMSYESYFENLWTEDSQSLARTLEKLPKVVVMVASSGEGGGGADAGDESSGSSENKVQEYGPGKGEGGTYSNPMFDAHGTAIDDHTDGQGRDLEGNELDDTGNLDELFGDGRGDKESKNPVKKANAAGSPDLDEMMDDAAYQAVFNAAEACKRQGGPVPPSAQSLMDGHTRPKVIVDWKQKLAGITSTLLCPEREASFRRPARRNVLRELPDGTLVPDRRYPLRGRTRTYAPRIALIADTSGSMSIRLFNALIAHLKVLFTDVKGASIRLFFADTEVREEHDLEDIESFPKEIAGRGGTDFDTPLKYVRDNMRPAPDLVIYFTDGWAATPSLSSYPKCPCIWMMTCDETQTHFKAHGEFIYMQEE